MAEYTPHFSFFLLFVKIFENHVSFSFHSTIMRHFVSVPIFFLPLSARIYSLTDCVCYTVLLNHLPQIIALYYNKQCSCVAPADQLFSPTLVALSIPEIVVMT